MLNSMKGVGALQKEFGLRERTDKAVYLCPSRPDKVINLGKTIRQKTQIL